MKDILDDLKKDSRNEKVEDSFAAAKLIIFLFFALINLFLWCIISNENSFLGVLFVIFYYFWMLFLVSSTYLLLNLSLKTGIIISDFLKMKFISKGIKKLSSLFSIINILTLFNIVLFIIFVIDGLKM